jgi:hypothetical protein
MNEKHQPQRKHREGTQMEAIKRAFANGERLSGLNAFYLTGTMNIVQRVADLKKENWVFCDRTLKVETRYGTPTSPKEYWLDKKLTPLEIYEQYLKKPVNKLTTETAEQINIFAEE